MDQQKDIFGGQTQQEESTFEEVYSQAEISSPVKSQTSPCFQRRSSHVISQKSSPRVKYEPVPRFGRRSSLQITGNSTDRRFTGMNKINTKPKFRSAKELGLMLE